MGEAAVTYGVPQVIKKLNLTLVSDRIERACEKEDISSVKFYLPKSDRL